jgi:hypothetical protein
MISKENNLGIFHMYFPGGVRTPKFYRGDYPFPSRWGEIVKDLDALIKDDGNLDIRKLKLRRDFMFRSAGSIFISSESKSSGLFDAMNGFSKFSSDLHDDIVRFYPLMIKKGYSREELTSNI